MPIASVLALVWFAPIMLSLSTSSSDWYHRALFAPASILAMTGCIAAAAITRRQERLAWMMMALGVFLMTLGDAVAVFSGGPLRQPLSNPDSLSGLLWLASFAPYLAALNFFVQPAQSWGVERARRFADIVLLFLCVTLVLFTVILFPLYGRDMTRPLAPTLFFFAALVTSVSLLIYLIATKPGLRPWHKPMMWALALVCVGSGADVVGAVLGIHWGARAGMIGLPWFLGYLLIAAGGFERVRLRFETPQSCVVVLSAPPSGLGIGLTALFFLLLPLFVYLDAIWNGGLVGDLTFSIVISVAAVTALVRNLAVVLENSSLRRRSVSDQLTGLFSHRHFHERLDVEIVRANRTGGLLSIVSMDVDDFDRINNVYGHATGDRRLKSIADRLASASRACDIVCRVGGDEFAIIMPDTGAAEAHLFCHRLQNDVRMPDDVCPLPSLMSMGVACLPEHARTREELVQRADGALYWAKFHGRAQVVIYDADLVRALGPDERITRLEEESYLDMVHLLSSAVDARDSNTQHHSIRVAELSVALAREVGLCDADIFLLETAALLHDVGKIGVPDAVLLKPGRLTAEEFGFIREHPMLATRMLGAIPHREILPWIAAHHEHWDGSGYPAGLAGEGIPLPSRILTLCDAFDAMTSDRPYRDRAMNTSEAREEIAACSGTHFDPALAPRFDVVLARLGKEATHQ